MKISLLARLLPAATFALVCALVSGCGFVRAKKDGERVLARHFQTIATNGYDAALADYGTQFFQKTTKEEWGRALAELTTRLGNYQSYTVTDWRVFKNAGTFGAGTTVTLQCNVTYSKYSATEKFTLFKGIADSDYQIVGHFINSDGLLKERINYENINYIQSKLLAGDTEALRLQSLTRWMSRDLRQAAGDFCRNIGLVPIYCECSPDHLTRYLFWKPPQGATFEARSGRTREKFEEFDRANQQRNMQLLSLHINESEIYSAVWISSDYLETARAYLRAHGITFAERHDDGRSPGN